MIKIKKKITSTLLRIKELKKFNNQNVEITIKPLKDLEKQKHLKEELLAIKPWELEEEVKVKTWEIKEF